MEEAKGDHNFMDFSDVLDFTKGLDVCRPILITDKHIVYQDETRSTQVMNEMHRFYQDERWCDVVLKVEEGSRFPSHRLVLAASSLYFEKMFTNGMSEENATEITLNQITACALKHLLEFAYTSKLSVSKDTVLEIFEAADMLQFPSARKFCQDFLLEQIECQNCLSFMIYADAFSCEQLFEKAKLCAASNFKLLCQTNDFLELPKNHLITLLKEDNIEMEYEEHVYEAMRAWVMHDKEKRKQFISELLQCIRLNYVSRWFLIEKISYDGLIEDSLEAKQFIQNAKDQLLAQGHTYEIPWQLPPSRKCTGLTNKIVYVSTYDPNPRESEVCVFDVVNKSWSNTSQPCPLASELSTCESVASERLLVIGGWNNATGTNKSMNLHGAVNHIHEFKVMSQIFPTLWYVGAHNMGISRYLHSTIVTEGDNKLFLMGGYDDIGHLQATVWVTDESLGYRFQVCPRMMYPLARPCLAQWENKIFAFGGFGEGGTPRQHVQCFDLHSQQWCEVKPGIRGMYTACQYAVALEGEVYVVTGELEAPQGEMSPMVAHLVPIVVVDAIHTYNPINKAWHTKFRFAEPLHGPLSITHLNNKIYFTGGRRRGSRYHGVDVYCPVSNSLEHVGHTREQAQLTLATTMNVMHENFGL